ncbi:MMPL domain protein [Segniliparus rotundus DSM 44985]|uniref:MMPL domain protein n=1 Tax=Segniliparus rotundus (strain ATCC BAA-972 / CDC 1076 / CIP 108378 / DSM 44985 / JCM 13578) TaxID=640132 RepID=D6Z787_SEGRD|nr:MMPL family transporter [Segniliparus rotundus]ADG97817.1 MMPL domain protein [Segniliparus rotundus DSM 44985]
MEKPPGQRKRASAPRWFDRLASHAAPLVVIVWLLAAIVANTLEPPARRLSNPDSSPMLPRDDPATTAALRAGTVFDGAGSNTTSSVVFESSRPLTENDHAYYTAVVTALRNDRAHVASVLGIWSDPLVAPASESKDHRASSAMMWLTGEAGSSQARDSAAAARAAVQSVPAPAGVRAEIVGPATTMGGPLDLTGAQAAVLCVVILLAIAALAWLLCRAALPVGMVLLTGALPSLVAVPLTGRAPVAALSGMPAFSIAVTVAFAMGAGAEFAVIFLREQRRQHGREDSPIAEKSALKLVAPRIWAIGASAAVLLGATALAPNPTVRGIAVPAAVGTALALLAGFTLLPALAALADARLGSPGGAASKSAAARRPTAALVCAMFAALAAAAPVAVGRYNDESHRQQAAPEHFPASQFLPTVVIVETGRDLRTPSGLIAIDRLTRRLMDMPGVRTVQSASWPGARPWSEATIAHQAGDLANQLQDQVSAFVPQIDAIKTLSATIDHVSTAADELERSMATGAKGLRTMQEAVGSISGGARDIQDSATALAANLDPVRHWTDGVANCAADPLCAALRKVIDPVDNLVESIARLSESANQVAAGSKTATEAFAGAPAAIARMKTALAAFKGVVAGLRTSVEDVLPQVVQLSARLRTISADFDDSGEGVFYVSQKTIDSLSYDFAKQLLFSPDGRATRLFVYGSSGSVADGSALRAAEVAQAVAANTKYGGLADGKVTITGAAAMSQSLYRNALMSVTALAAALAAGALLAAGLTRRPLVSALSAALAAASSVAALGLNIAFWQCLVGDTIDRTAALAACALAAPVAFAHNIAVLTAVRRPGTTMLAAAGMGLGAGLLLVATGAQKDVGQTGMVIVGALAANLALARICRAFTAAEPTGNKRSTEGRDVAGTGLDDEPLAGQGAADLAAGGLRNAVPGHENDP